ncbi:hypothetical protein ACI2KR_07265 [Pseudomonas luteola]
MTYIKHQNNGALRMSGQETYENLFSHLISFLDLNEYRVKGFSEGVTLSLCNDSLGLLPNWMFRADMISVMLQGKRCFDVIYERNSNAISSLAFTEFSLSTAPLHTKETYLEYPFAEDMPASLRSLIASLAVTESLGIDKNLRQVDIKPLSGFFAMPSEGQSLNFPSLLAIEGKLFHEMVQKVMHVIKLEHEPEHRLER